jgi:hypothetical protein
MTTTMWVVLALGVFLGMFVGRWRAENGRARHDMDKTWNARKDYRGG